MKNLNKILISHILLFIVNFIYGTSMYVSKYLMPTYLTPEVFVFFRIIFSFILFLIIFLFSFKRIKYKDFFYIGLSAFFGIFLNQYLYFKGLNITSPIDSGVIIVMTPVLVALISIILLKSKLSLYKVLGIFIGLIGASILIYLSAKSSSKISSFEGNMYIFANAISYAIYLVMIKPIMKKYSPILVATYLFFFGSIYITLFNFNNLSEIRFDFTINIWILISYIIIFTTFFNYIANIYAVKYVNPLVTSIYIYLQPIFAMLTAYYFYIKNINLQYANDLSYGKLLCSLLILLGIFLTSYEQLINYKKKIIKIKN